MVLRASPSAGFLRRATLKMVLRISPGEVFVMPISDSQIFIALFAALLAGIFAIRLGIELYA